MFVVCAEEGYELKRSDILNRITALTEEQVTIMQSVFERMNISLWGRPHEERMQALQRNDGSSFDEWVRIREIEDSVKGLRHMLDNGFFALNQPREKREERWLY